MHLLPNASLLSLLPFVTIITPAFAQQQQHHTTGPAQPTPSWGCQPGCQSCGGLTCWEWCPPQLPVAECYRDPPQPPCLNCYRAGGNYCGALLLADPSDDFCVSCAENCICVIGGICLDDDDGDGPPTSTPTSTPATPFVGYGRALPDVVVPRDAFDGRGPA